MLQVKLEVIKNLASIIPESVKPMEQIDEIKIYQVAGLGGVAGGEKGNGAAPQTGTESGSLAEQMVSGALRYRAQAPLVDTLMREIGLSGENLGSLAKGIYPKTSEVPTPVNGAARKVN